MLKTICAMETQTLVHLQLQSEVRTGFAEIIHLLWEPFPFGKRKYYLGTPDTLSEPFSKLWAKSLCCNGWAKFVTQWKSFFLITFSLVFCPNRCEHTWTAVRASVGVLCWIPLVVWCVHVMLRIPHLSESNCGGVSVKTLWQFNS